MVTHHRIMLVAQVRYGSGMSRRITNLKYIEKNIGGKIIYKLSVDFQRMKRKLYD